MGLPNRILLKLRQKVSHWNFCNTRRCVEFLYSQGVLKPTAIQMQGIPVILGGRDMIGIGEINPIWCFLGTKPSILAQLQLALGKR